MSKGTIAKMNILEKLKFLEKQSYSHEWDRDYENEDRLWGEVNACVNKYASALMEVQYCKPTDEVSLGSGVNVPKYVIVALDALS